MTPPTKGTNLPSTDWEHVFITYFDANFAARGIVMLRSLLRHAPGTRILVLGLDPIVRQILRCQMPESVTIVEPEELYSYDPELMKRNNRKRKEYYATHKPVLALYAMHCGATAVTYIDADIQFLASPTPLFTEIGDASIAVSPHRFAQRAKSKIPRFGRFNAGWAYWRNDDAGRRCLADWRADCLAWCYDRHERDGRFMNQGYLTIWPERYPGVRIIDHPGANLAYWNIDGHHLALRDGAVTVDGQNLIFYHFSGLPPDGAGLWRAPHLLGYRNQAIARETIHEPYIKALNEVKQELRREYGITGLGAIRPSRSAILRLLSYARLVGLTLLHSWKYRFLRNTRV